MNHSLCSNSWHQSEDQCSRRIHEARTAWAQAFDIRRKPEVDPLLGTIEPITAERIDYALEIRHVSCARRQTGKSLAEKSVGDPRRQRLDLPAYFTTVDAGVRRWALRKVLVQAFKLRPEVSFDPPFALFCTHVMTVMQSFRQSIMIVGQLWKDYKLHEYYFPAAIPGISPPAESAKDEHAPSRTPVGTSLEEAIQTAAALTPAVSADIRLVVDKVEESWPPVIEAFRRFKRWDLFVNLVRDWLRSLMCSCFDEKKQPFDDYLPLLHRVVVVGTLPSDPIGTRGTRARLIYIASRILGRFTVRFQRLQWSRELELLTAQLQAGVLVDAALIDALDFPKEWVEVAATAGMQAAVCPLAALASCAAASSLSTGFLTFAAGIGAPLHHPMLLNWVAGISITAGGVLGFSLAERAGGKLTRQLMDTTAETWEAAENAENERAPIQSEVISCSPWTMFVDVFSFHVTPPPQASTRGRRCSRFCADLGLEWYFNLNSCEYEWSERDRNRRDRAQSSA